MSYVYWLIYLVFFTSQYEAFLSFKSHQLVVGVVSKHQTLLKGTLSIIIGLQIGMETFVWTKSVQNTDPVYTVFLFIKKYNLNQKINIKQWNLRLSSMNSNKNLWLMSGELEGSGRSCSRCDTQTSFLSLNIRSWTAYNSKVGNVHLSWRTQCCLLFWEKLYYIFVLNISYSNLFAWKRGKSKQTLITKISKNTAWNYKQQADLSDEILNVRWILNKRYTNSIESDNFVWHTQYVNNVVFWFIFYIYIYLYKLSV